MKEITEKEALQKAARYCSTSEHCIFEVVAKLKTWGVDAETSDRIIDYLIKEKYIDENRYCKSFVHDKLYNNGWGRMKITQALWQKRIPAQISERALQEINEEDYIRILQSLLKSRKRTIKAQDDYELRNKLIRFAMSRGFEKEIISRCIQLPDDE